MLNLDNLCNICKLSFWKWDLVKNKFTMSGHFGLFEGFHQEFLNRVDSRDRAALEKIFLEFRENKLSFEKKFRVLRDFSQWVLIRGYIDTSDQAQGILVDITQKNSNELNSSDTQAEFSTLTHDLTQSLMVINTYISGCLYRLKDSTIDSTQLNDIMTTMKHHSTLMSDKIHELKNCIRPL